MRYERSTSQLADTQPVNENPEIMTVSMLADYLRCHPSTIYRLLRQKRLPGFKIGSDWRFKKSVIDQWLKEVTVSALEE
jgi:excisionase family DNA binding protein